MITTDAQGYWHGDSFQDLATYLQYVTAGSRTAIRQSVCAACGGAEFRLNADPALRDGGGAAQRVCVQCGRLAYLADSRETWPLAKPKAGLCPVCQGDGFEMGVAFVLEGTETQPAVSWIYVGARCTTCRALLSPLDWEIAYSPSSFVLNYY